MLKTLRSRDAAMPFIMLTVLLDMVAIGLIIPVLPALVGSFSASKADQAYWYGVIAFSFGISNFLMSPVLGALSDQFGRRPVLLLGFLAIRVLLLRWRHQSPAVAGMPGAQMEISPEMLVRARREMALEDELDDSGPKAGKD